MGRGKTDASGRTENQTVEWKASWRDDYLQWICGFANAQGGTLEIGRDNEGRIVGLPNAAKLMEELPNKIRATMGIIAQVNLCHESGKDYISIKVAAHHNAISYRGRYYSRSGSTNQELTGFALDELLLSKYGKSWDSVPIPHVKANDFYRDAFAAFRKKALASNRLLHEDVEVPDAELLRMLKLTEGDYLLRAAPLLFHHDPETWCLGSYVKIGFFKDDAELVYQDEIKGPLITVPDRVMDTVFTKYFKGLIRYEGIQRIEEYPVPREVLREAVLNAVVHKDYSTGNPIHIKVSDNSVVIYNDCQLPVNMKPESLLRGMGSKPHNPLIANAFFRSGQIEAWGRGIAIMKKGCIANGLAEPVFEIAQTTFSVCFKTRGSDKVASAQVVYSTNGGGINEINSGINETRKKIVGLMKADPSTSTQQIAQAVGIDARSAESHVRWLKKAGIVEREGAKKNGRWVVKKMVYSNSK